MFYDFVTPNKISKNTIERSNYLKQNIHLKVIEAKQVLLLVLLYLQVIYGYGGFSKDFM